jgi:hypothetical protein
MHTQLSNHRNDRARGFRFAFALGLLALSGIAVTGACSDGGEVAAASGGNTCVGGVINPDTGLCEGKCTADKCIAQNTCVDNRCMLKCDSHLDCFDTQDCTLDTEDDTMTSVLVCEAHAQATGFGWGCPFGNECDTALACPDGTKCDQCAGNPAACVLDTTACAGDPNCKKGKCPDQSACVVPTCAPTECKPLTCLTKGEGDADAYCSMLHCESDTECPGGYYCGIARDPHLICGTMKGDNAFCGETTEACIDPMTFTQGGATFEEGPSCLLRKQCMKRGQCNTCANDLDCSQVVDQRCVTIGPDARCSRNCSIIPRCPNGDECDPMACNGNLAACTLDTVACAGDPDCTIGKCPDQSPCVKCSDNICEPRDCDPDYFCVANPTPNDPMNGSCVPRFGACIGTGQYCEPCLSDKDCGGATSTVSCVEGSGGQRACFDRSFSVSCTTDADCPISPSGKHGECFDAAEGYDSTHPLYHKCYLPYQAMENKYGCW